MTNTTHKLEATTINAALPFILEIEPGTYEWHDSTDYFPPNNRPQDGRVCDCEDAPCCGHYES